jgi:3-deoxy-D-manno-octulosonic-acid transferase
VYPDAGEVVLCLPIIHRVVVEYNEKVLILVTVRCEDTLTLLRSSLPERVLLARAPADATIPVRCFLEHWKPCLGVFLTEWPAPQLILESAQACSYPHFGRHQPAMLHCPRAG